MEFTTVRLATPKTATAPATFTILIPLFDQVASTLAEAVNLATAVQVLTRRGYTLTEAMTAMVEAADWGAVTRGTITRATYN